MFFPAQRQTKRKKNIKRAERTDQSGMCSQLTKLPLYFNQRKCYLKSNSLFIPLVILLLEACGRVPGPEQDRVLFPSQSSCLFSDWVGRISIPEQRPILAGLWLQETEKPHCFVASVMPSGATKENPGSPPLPPKRYQKSKNINVPRSGL